MIQMLLGQPLEQAGLSELTTVVSGASPLPDEVRREFEARVPSALIYEGYGCTEAASFISANLLGARRAGSVGLPAPGCEVSIQDDNGRTLPGRPGRRDLRPLPWRDDRLLELAGHRGPRGRLRLAAHRRHRPPGRRQLPLRGGQEEGPDHPGWLQRLWFRASAAACPARASASAMAAACCPGPGPAPPRAHGPRPVPRRGGRRAALALARRWHAAVPVRRRRWYAAARARGRRLPVPAWFPRGRPRRRLRPQRRAARLARPRRGPGPGRPRRRERGPRSRRVARSIASCAAASALAARAPASAMAAALSASAWPMAWSVSAAAALIRPAASASAYSTRAAASARARSASARASAARCSACSRAASAACSCSSISDAVARASSGSSQDKHETRSGPASPCVEVGARPGRRVWPPEGLPVL